jgi:hypothetical protein
MLGIMIPENALHEILALGKGWRARAVDYVEKDAAFAANHAGFAGGFRFPGELYPECWHSL